MADIRTFRPQSRGGRATEPVPAGSPSNDPERSPSAGLGRLGRLPAWAGWILLAAGFALLARLGYLLLDPATRVAVWWPPNGLYLAALLMLPRRRWPVVAAVLLPVSVGGSLLRGRPLELAAWFFAGNTLEVVLGALLVQRIAGRRPSPATVRGALALTVVPAAVGALVSVAPQAVRHLVGAGRFPLTTWVFFAGSSLGAVITAPLLLAFAFGAPGGRWSRGRLAEAAAVAAALGTALLLVGGAAGPLWAHHLVLIPPLLWAAYRFGQRGATVALFAAAAGAVWAATWQRGAPAAGSAGGFDDTLALQVALSVIAVTVLYLGAAAEERQRAQRDVSEARDLLAAFFDNAPIGMFIKDERHRAVRFSRQMEAMAGQPLRQLLGRTVTESIPGPTGQLFLDMERRALASGAPVREEVRVGDRAVLDVVFPVPRAGGAPYVGGFAMDVTDRLRAEASARLAGVGTLAAGVAHEINNPLAFMVGNLAWVRERLEARLSGGPEEPTAGLLEALAEVSDGAERVRTIVRDLRLFARPPGDEASADPAAAVRSSAAIAQNEIRHRARLVLDLEAVDHVPVAENRLAQVFLNLLVNAAQAIPEGHAGDNEIRVSLRRGAGATVVAEVTDTGVGMGPEVRARLFEPFFTTKSVGEGTGLGLFVCHGIVSELGGRIDVESEPGRGSRFRVTLPSAAPAPAPAPAAARPERSGPPRGRILVLDDDPLVARTIRRLLEPPHEVEALASGREALRRLGEGARWDVVLCDLMMPEMTGMEWHAEVARTCPELAARVVLVTGGAFTEAARDFLRRVRNPRLEKPFEPAAVRRVVAEVLAERGRVGPGD